MPENMNLYCGMINAKLNAVTAGLAFVSRIRTHEALPASTYHNFKLFHMLTGTAALTRSNTPEGDSPVRIACMPKKYVLKTGVKTACCTHTFVRIEPQREE